jgi:hypothetical protein
MQNPDTIEDLPLPKPSESVTFRKMEEGGVLFCSRTEVYFGLNAVGVVIWEEIAGTPRRSHSLDHLVSRLRIAFPEIDRGVLAVDAQEFLAALEQSELVDYGASPEP